MAMFLPSARVILCADMFLEPSRAGEPSTVTVLPTKDVRVERSTPSRNKWPGGAPSMAQWVIEPLASFTST